MKTIVKCKKDFYYENEKTKILNFDKKTYVAKIIGDEILVQDVFGNYNLVGVRKETAKEFNVETTSLNGWDKYFSEHFEIVEQ